MYGGDADDNAQAAHVSKTLARGMYTTWKLWASGSGAPWKHLEHRAWSKAEEEESGAFIEVSLM